MPSAVWGMAGFAKQRGNFYIKRNIPVPEELLELVFPEAKVWYDRHQNADRVCSNIAAGGFLKLILELRSVFIQDSVLLRQAFPSHFVFKNKIYELPLYTSCEKRLTQRKSPHISV